MSGRGFIDFYGKTDMQLYVFRCGLSNFKMILLIVATMFRLQSTRAVHALLFDQYVFHALNSGYNVLPAKPNGGAQTLL